MRLRDCPPPGTFALSNVPARLPPTRYQGSKRKLVGWIGAHLAELDFDTVLDAFGGTASVSYELKRMGKQVTYNDVLKFNHLIGMALIENQSVRLGAGAIDGIVRRDPGATYDDFVERSFGDIYFTDDENRWLDMAVQNIRRLTGPSQRAIAYYALFQAALVKRPYNLFHRRNLYMRQADVARSFGNKVTWDQPFEACFRRFVRQADDAVFDNGRPCRAIHGDAVDIAGRYDLVYIDPPYTSARGVGVNYRQFYHFLEGLADYDRWPERVDWSSKHRRLIPQPDCWSTPSLVGDAFAAIFERFSDSLIVVSYRSDGIPSIDDLVAMLKRYKRRVAAHARQSYQYALSTNRTSREVLLIAR